MSDLLDARDQLDATRAKIKTLAVLTDQSDMLSGAGLSGLAQILTDAAVELDAIAATLARVSRPDEAA